MRRSQLLIVVTAISLAGFVILLAALTAAPAKALPAEFPLAAQADAAGQLNTPREPNASLQIEVNYADDQVAGATTTAHASVMITVTDGDDAE